MKNLHLPFLRFVPKPLRLTRLFHRAPAAPPKLLEAPREPSKLSYAPLWIGGVALPFVIETKGPRRKRDPCD